ncbi:hypothetical protein [Acinetobacter indicus]|uniref:hypothetical protein n=1 Tax=Acinetobacter indicus TaxID=756892 RepID=UPI000CEC834B|nr:hypothetical protein [Acinetobacter indicus]
MSKTLDNFYAALQRLKEGKPKFIDFPYSINNDTVSLEAQRKRGTIKKSRPELTQLIIDIAKAEAIRTGKQPNPSSTNVQDDKLKKAESRITELEEKLAELEEKYKAQQAQLNMQMYRNKELLRKVQNAQKTESSLLDFMKS